MLITFITHHRLEQKYHNKTIAEAQKKQAAKKNKSSENDDHKVKVYLATNVDQWSGNNCPCSISPNTVAHLTPHNLCCYPAIYKNKRNNKNKQKMTYFVNMQTVKTTCIYLEYVMVKT